MNQNAKLTVSSTAKGVMGLPAAAKAYSATVQVTENEVRFTVDGTLPVDGSDGLIAAVGSTILLENRDEVNKFRAILDGGGPDAVLQIVFEPRKKHATNFTNTEA